MPSYDYYCETCDAIDNVFSSMADMKEEIDCPFCQGKRKLLVSTPHFKVTGANANNGYSGDSNFKTLKIGTRVRS